MPGPYAAILTDYAIALERGIVSYCLLRLDGVGKAVVLEPEGSVPEHHRQGWPGPCVPRGRWRPSRPWWRRAAMTTIHPRSGTRLAVWGSDTGAEVCTFTPRHGTMQNRDAC